LAKALLSPKRVGAQTELYRHRDLHRDLRSHLRADLSGTDLSGWTMAVGDGLHVAPGEAPITEADIATTHLGTHSELRANLLRRRIMVHNLMYKKIVDPAVLAHSQRCAYDFRLPFVPAKGNTEVNAQTLEGGVAIWEGAVSRLNHNVAFQWLLNPYGNFGAIRAWSAADSGTWREVGHLPVDTAWHRVQFVNDYQQQLSQLIIDDVPYPSEHVILSGPTEWSNDVSATMGAEIISIFPGDAIPGALHVAEFRNWCWEWSPPLQHQLFLPIARRGAG
jgi:hypothetical protein